MSGFHVKKFSKDEVICQERSTGNVAYILREGRVEISVNVDGTKKVLAVLEPVTVFGVMALVLKDHKRTATATVLEHAEVVEIEKKDFDEYIEKSPKVITAALKALVDRLLDTTTRLKKHEKVDAY